ncbi:hypothetical protein HZS_6434 [Henneguya salminicola]|nr:hypothetical protein HZS_6434 [Henneguya salminicola]
MTQKDSINSKTLQSDIYTYKQKNKGYFPTRIEGYFYNIPAVISIDTGSSLSFISSELFQKILSGNPMIESEPCSRISSAADSSTLKTEYTTYLHLSLPPISLRQHFYITNGLIIPAVLGTDFLMTHKCVLDFKKNKMHFKEYGIIFDFNYNVMLVK